ncbi:MAG TPA: hypothetical protein VNZ48_00725, partial [Xanthobacteraceae bacterium]|nr:hypothetical protein [Xanthobacteraceae bacterium]
EEIHELLRRLRIILDDENATACTCHHVDLRCTSFSRKLTQLAASQTDISVRLQPSAICAFPVWRRVPLFIEMAAVAGNVESPGLLNSGPPPRCKDDAEIEEMMTKC